MTLNKKKLDYELAKQQLQNSPCFQGRMSAVDTHLRSNERKTSHNKTWTQSSQIVIINFMNFVFMNFVFSSELNFVGKQERSPENAVQTAERGCSFFQTRFSVAPFTESEVQ